MHSLPLVPIIVTVPDYHFVFYRVCHCRIVCMVPYTYTECDIDGCVGGWSWGPVQSQLLGLSFCLVTHDILFWNYILLHCVFKNTVLNL